MGGFALLRSFACLVCLTACFGHAELERFPAPPNPLSKGSVHGLDRLSELRTFGGVKWEWHRGDVSHGEDFAQNDGQWKTWDGKMNAGTGAIWIRAKIEIPKVVHGYNFRGAGLIFSPRVSPSGTVPEILYLDGRRIALGTDLEPEVLSASLHPGQILTVALKLLATTDDKLVQQPELSIRFAPWRPDPWQLRAECLSAAYLLPTLDKDPQVLASDLAAVERAVGQINFSALDRGQQGAFDASLRRAEESLLPLKPKLQTLTIDAVGNSHLDAAWRWPWTDTLEAVKCTFTTALQLMPEYPRYKYAQPDVQYDDWLENNYPALFGEMKARAKDGRWDVIGGMWAEPDFNEPDGESMTRELLLGKRYIQSRFGTDVKIGWNVDSFGYSWQLPQVYKKSGVDFFVTQKINWNETNRLPLKLFWWQSPDGSSVLTYFPMSYNGSTDPVQMAEELANSRPLAPGLSEVMHLFGVGDHGGGATRVDLDQADRWSDGQKIYPKLSMSSPSEFFASIGPKASAVANSPVWNYETLKVGTPTLPPAVGDGISIPVWRDELYLETHRGTYTTQARQKQNMRDSEEWLLDAEKLSSLSWSIGTRPYPQASLNDAWKKLLFNTNHDLAAGSGIGSIYKDAQSDYDAVYEASRAATHDAVDWMLAGADTRTADPLHESSVVVLNTLGWPRDGVLAADIQLPGAIDTRHLVVRDAAGKTVPSQILWASPGTGQFKVLLEADNVPAMGYKVLRVSEGNSDVQGDLHVDESSLENSKLRVLLDPKTGCITHLISKEDGFDSIADGGCGNQLQTFIDKPAKYDAWNIDAEALDKMTPISSVDSIFVAEKGPIRASVTIKRHWGQSQFDQTIVLYAGKNRVDIENHFDWRETHVLLKVAFPLRASSEKAAFEIPYGVIDRPTTRENSIDQAKFEVPALRWADLGDGEHGFSLINNSKYGYDATSHQLRLSMLRSPLYPDPDADRGTQVFVFSLYPHAGTWQSAMTERRGYEFNYPLTAYQTEKHDGPLGSEHSFLDIDDPAAMLTALKKSEDGNALILRAYDWSGKPSDLIVRLPGSPTSASEADMMEHSIGPDLPLAQATVRAQMRPYEIKTLRIEYPRATTERTAEFRPTSSGTQP
jgi:alpha-mannosidase